MLLFKKKFIDLIRRGEKTQTIRFWPHRRMKAGQRSYIPGIGYISILEVEAVEIDQLTDADAKPDGFETAMLLRKELRTLYAEEIQKGYQAFRVRFSVLAPREQQRLKEEKQRQKEVDAKRRRNDAAQKMFVDQTLEKLKKMTLE